MKFIALAWFCFALAVPADAQCVNGVCRQRVVAKQRIVQKPAVIQQQYLPQVSYQIGTHLQQNAVGTAVLRQSDEYQELQRLRGFRAAVELLAQQQAVGAIGGPAAGTPEEPEPLAEYTTKFPRIVATCGKCHSGDSPKGNIWLDGTVDILSAEHAELRDRIMRESWNNRMPPNKGLDDDTLGAIIGELYAERTEETE